MTRLLGLLRTEMLPLRFLPALGLLAGCSALTPRFPPTEVVPSIEAIHAIVWDQQQKLENEPVENNLVLLDQTVSGLATRYGRRSVELIKGLTETSSLLASEERYDLALPYMERALVLSRVVYGSDHRETAFYLNDVAVLLCAEVPCAQMQRAESLFREAVEVRRRRAGVNHPETAASEYQLAWLMLIRAGVMLQTQKSMPSLHEVEELALHAHKVFTEHNDPSYKMHINRILIETAFARKDYDEFERRVQSLLGGEDYEKGPGLYPDATAKDLLERAVAYRGVGGADCCLP